MVVCFCIHNFKLICYSSNVKKKKEATWKLKILKKMNTITTQNKFHFNNLHIVHVAAFHGTKHQKF